MVKCLQKSLQDVTVVHHYSNMEINVIHKINRKATMAWMTKQLTSMKEIMYES